MNLKIERIKRRMSQTILSRETGVSRTTISKIENGDIRNVRFESLLLIAEYLEMTVQELFLEGLS